MTLLEKQAGIVCEMLRGLIAEFQHDGIPDHVIASGLGMYAGSLWQKMFPDIEQRRGIVMAEAEFILTGKEP